MEAKDLIPFWEDATVEFSGSSLRTTIPPEPRIGNALQVVRGGHETLALMAYQVAKTEDKKVILRAIASALSCIFEDNTNFTGATSTAVPLTGLAALAGDVAPSEDSLMHTNFEDQEAVTAGEMNYLIDADIDELGAYFGMLFMAGTKRLTPQNRTAFNELRVENVRSRIIGDPRIFIPNSIFLDDKVLQRVYATFTSQSSYRYFLVSRAAAKMGTVSSGARSAFASTFMLLSDSGMGALRIIKEATLKYPWIRTDFPELIPELGAASMAQQRVRQAEPAMRPFVKAIWASDFVPMSYQQTSNLLGVCKRVLEQSNPSYVRYNGGKILPHQEAYIRKKLSERAVVLGVGEDVEEAPRA